MKRSVFLVGSIVMLSLLFPLRLLAASCCGGGSAGSLSVPKYARGVVDLALDTELYDGYWDGKGKWRPDPPASDLRQYRLNLGGGYRLGERVQGSLILPFVFNDNRYAGVSSQSRGLGDISLSLLYELRDDLSSWKVYEPKDLIPAVSVGVTLTLPTGISPYDGETSSFDITGRGFYRLDGTLLVEKSLRPWNISLSGGYGTWFERPVNREYGRYVTPYRKDLGDRLTLSGSLGYTWVIGDGGNSLSTTGTWSRVSEGDASYDGRRDPGSGFNKQSFGISLSWSNVDSNWSARLSLTHSLRSDGWGENFPTTDIISAGVKYVFD